MADGARVRSGAVSAEQVESVRLEARGGADTVRVGGLAGTGISQVAVDLGGPDGSADSVSLEGSGGADDVVLSGGAGGIGVSGLGFGMSLAGTEIVDRLSLDTLAGADTVDASALAANAVSLTLRGGPDGDTLTGSAGGDLFEWRPG